MSELRFAEPQWLYAAGVVAIALLALIALDRRGDRTLERLVGSALQPRLVSRPTALRRRLRLALLGLSALSLVVALMRPQWGVEFVKSRQIGAEIMIALDVSRSMLAEDVAPNRLDRAKAEIRDLLTYLDGDQVGLIAFAGRATVVCPLTPDFGFVRLVLDGLGPHSVSRGGTRLEEPIRKATAGFGSSGDLSRVILLITDGEDHDSFPVDAAKDAAALGIRILAIGFGDENGSPITLTDPETGARTTLRDSDGRPVQSRLDGDLLRELAMVTEGAYVPAGTGVLDLEGIFSAHIRPLMRATGEERGRTIHKDAFQWAILLALVALLGSVATSATRLRILMLMLALTPCIDAGQAHAQVPAPAGPAAQGMNLPGPEGEPSTSDEDDPRDHVAIPEEPREAYNQGIRQLDEDRLDEAERLLEAARNNARGDGTTRFRASFNLGWVEIRRSETTAESDGPSALRSLERAADWFREAIAIDSDSREARRNLELVLRRILVLADALAKEDPRDVAAQLDALIASQRGVAASARQVAEIIQRSDDPEAALRLKPQFKQVAVEARRILGEARALVDAAGGELDSLEQRADEELTPEERMRAAQLQGVLHYLHRARERIGQARSQLRQHQAARAYRRAAAALSELKRARDQLRAPVQLLDILIQDATAIAGETRALATTQLGAGIPGIGQAQRAESPSWLTPLYLGEAQGSIAERIDELDAQLRAGLEQTGAVEDPQQQALLEQVAEAQPFVAEASEHAAAAAESLYSEALQPGAEAQAEALTALIAARERFLDLKGLIEVAYADERRIDGLLNPNDEEIALERIREYGPALGALQRKNLERVQRITPMLEEQRNQLMAATAGGDAAPEGPSDPAQELERIELADGILMLTESSMQGAADSLDHLGATESALDDSRNSVSTAIKGLESLRRLFFSIVEHLEDTAHRQVELGDDTEQALALAEQDPDASAARVGPVAPRQDELAAFTDQLAQALHEQSLADPAELIGAEAAADEAVAQAATEQLIRASELVLAASEEMRNAATGLREAAPERETIRAQQTTAVNKLAEAITLLQPPQQEQANDQEEDSGEQGEAGEQQQGQGQDQQAATPAEQPQPSPEEQAGRDPGQMLQSVRDREAERHRRNAGRNQQGYEPVERDW
ncbi:MAG: VWA domain-containing protein [Deltaproteobacteria bacterium]|nr:VWA domain-containing protein [Deltaproteobacteria bacterium]